jgi:hypothetical protein
MKDFIRDGLSIDESRLSVMIISYIISFLTIVALCIYLRDVETMKAVFFANATAITGINVTNSIVSNTKAKDDTTTQTSEQSDWPRG